MEYTVVDDPHYTNTLKMTPILLHFGKFVLGVMVKQHLEYVKSGFTITGKVEWQAVSQKHGMLYGV